MEIGIIKKYQITNPNYVSSDTNAIKKVFSNYSLTDGLTEKKYHNIISKVLKNLPDLEEWQNDHILKKFGNISWKKAITELHNPKILKKVIF